MVVASGESVIPKHLGEEPLKSMCNYASKVVCVSSKNKNESINLGLTTEDKCRVFPNAIDNSLFRALEQAALKKSLGIKKTDFTCFRWVVYQQKGVFARIKGNRKIK